MVPGAGGVGGEPHGHRGGRWSGGETKGPGQMLGEEPREPRGRAENTERPRGRPPLGRGTPMAPGVGEGRAENPKGSGGGRRSGGNTRGT